MAKRALATNIFWKVVLQVSMMHLAREPLK